MSTVYRLSFLHFNGSGVVGKPIAIRLRSSSPPLDGCRRPARSLIDTQRPGVPCRRSTGVEQSTVGRPSYTVASRFPMTARHFCSGLTGLTFAIDCVKCTCSVFRDNVTTISTCLNNNTGNNNIPYRQYRKDT